MRWESGRRTVAEAKSTGGLSFRVFGPIDVERAGRSVDIGGPKPRALLAALILRRERTVQTDTLIDAVWGDRGPKTAAKTLQKYVSQLRKRLGSVLATRSNGYALEVGCEQVDACRFEGLVDRAADRDSRDAVALLTEALGLWRGEPFPELADWPDGIAERTRLEERRLEALERLMRAELDMGHHRRIVGRLEELVAQHPLREQLWSPLMIALYRSGRQVEALRAYQRLRAELANVGIEPSPELQDLENRILQQDPGLEFRSPGGVRASTNLPIRLTSFIGRDRELEELGRLLPTSRLVTLIGPGGSGKTRLALECAESTVDDYRDGSWFVDLAPLTSPDEVAKAVADPLGLKGQPGRPVDEVLVDHLAGRRLQLVIDNCEHLLSGVAVLVTRLLQSAPELNVLATSRAPLGVEGETTFEVPPLPVPEGKVLDEVGDADAVRLFIDRCQAVDPHFELIAENAAAVAEICRRLDGIPLALELAAARIRSFSPFDIAGLLGDRFSVLISPVRTVAARHQTLQAAMDWSYDLLAEPEKKLFGRLSVFRGGFDLESVRGVCTADPLERAGAVASLEELIEHSLVVIDHRHREGTRRYRVLETLREYGRSRLNATETTQVRDAHAVHFCKLAEQAAPHLRGAEQQEWLGRLSLDYANLRKALRWSFDQMEETGVRLAIALADYWDAVGPRTEAQNWLGRAVQLTNSCCPDLYIPVRLAASDLFVSTQLSHSIRFAREALASARREGDEHSEAAALRALGWAEALREDYELAVSLLEESLQIWRELGDRWEIAWCLERLGQSDYHHPEDALRRFEESLALFGEVGDRRRAGMVLYKMAEAGVRAGVALEATEKWVEESLGIFDELSSVHDSAHAFLELGKIKRRRGRPEAAREALDEGLERMQMVGDQRCTARTLTALGITLIECGDDGRARDVLGQSLSMARVLDERQNTRVALAGAARLLLKDGRSRDAARLSAVADRIGNELGVAMTTGSRRTDFRKELRSALDPDDFEAAEREGRKMSLTEAVELALRSLRDSEVD